MAVVSAANSGVFVILIPQSREKNLRSFSYQRAREANSQRCFASLNMTGRPGGRDMNKKDKLRECSDNADFAIMTQVRELRLAKRMARLGTETAFEVLVKARALEAKGRDIIHLEIGEPDFDTPANIIDAACDALHKSFTHYGPSAGLPQLRKVIAQHVSETRRINVIPEEVVIVPGGKPIIFFGILALVEDGDEVIYRIPAFPSTNQ